MSERREQEGWQARVAGLDPHTPVKDKGIGSGNTGSWRNRGVRGIGFTVDRTEDTSLITARIGSGTNKEAVEVVDEQEESGNSWLRASSVEEKAREGGILPVHKMYGINKEKGEVEGDKIELKVRIDKLQREIRERAIRMMPSRERLAQATGVAVLTLAYVFGVSGCQEDRQRSIEPQAEGGTPALVMGGEAEDTVEATEVIPPTAVVVTKEVAQPEASPTPELVTYPKDDSGFMTWREDSAQAEARLRELGVEGDITSIKDLINQEMQRTGRDPSSIEWEYSVNEQAESPGWLMMARDTQTGQLLWPVITQGEGENLMEISGGLAKYIGREGDFFDLRLLESPEIPHTRQELVKDESGWFVAGLVKEDTGEVVGWFDALNEDWEIKGQEMTDTEEDNSPNMDQEVEQEDQEEVENVGINSVEFVNSLENVVEIELNQGIVGKAIVEGEVVELNYPNIQTPNVKLGLYKFNENIINPDAGQVEDLELTPEGEVNLYYNFNDVAIYEEHNANIQAGNEPPPNAPQGLIDIDAKYGIGPDDWGEIDSWEEVSKRQVIVDVLYTHYRAWQHDQNDLFISERSGVSFLQYLERLDSEDGFDGGHLLIVRSTADRLYADEEPVYVTPESTDIISAKGEWEFDNEPGIGGIVGDRNILLGESGELILVERMKCSDESDFACLAPSASYRSLINLLSQMSLPFEQQTANFSEEEIDRTRGDAYRTVNSEVQDQIFHENLGSRATFFTPVIDWYTNYNDVWR